MVKNLPASVGGVRERGSNLGWGRCPGGGHGNPLQYSCLENPMDRGTRQATVHSVTKSQRGCKRLSSRSSNKRGSKIELLSVNGASLSSTHPLGFPGKDALTWPCLAPGGFQGT